VRIEFDLSYSSRHIFLPETNGKEEYWNENRVNEWVIAIFQCTEFFLLSGAIPSVAGLSFPEQILGI
jgi:hypothetical protein